DQERGVLVRPRASGPGLIHRGRSRDGVKRSHSSKILTERDKVTPRRQRIPHTTLTDVSFTDQDAVSVPVSDDGGRASPSGGGRSSHDITYLTVRAGAVPRAVCIEPYALLRTYTTPRGGFVSYASLWKNGSASARCTLPYARVRADV